MTAPRAEVLAIGDELTHGHGIDTNSAFIARELELLGLSVRRFTVVSDDPQDLQAAIEDACARARIVVATGGLGPTEDDRTREAAARAAGVNLAFHDASWVQIGAFFASRGRALPDSNRRQAMLPDGGEALENLWGTAPGFCLEIGGALLFALPGVPAEMRGMYRRYVLPCLRREVAGARPLAFHQMQVLGVSEAELGERLAPFMRPSGDVQVGITARSGLLTVRIAAAASSADAARARCAETADRLRPLCGKELVCEGEGSLADRVGRALIELRVTTATAESCTGGLLACRLTDVPGISAVFLAGYVSYTDAAKERDLGVPAALLEEHGAVSEPVARAMAEGAVRRTGARLGVGITGIAGPGGGTAEKPVGTVCFGLSVDARVRAWRRRIYPVSREFVRERSVLEVLAELYRELDRLPAPRAGFPRE